MESYDKNSGEIIIDGQKKRERRRWKRFLVDGAYVLVMKPSLFGISGIFSPAVGITRSSYGRSRTIRRSFLCRLQVPSWQYRCTKTCF